MCTIHYSILCLTDTFRDEPTGDGLPSPSSSASAPSGCLQCESGEERRWRKATVKFDASGKSELSDRKELE